MKYVFVVIVCIIIFLIIACIIGYIKVGQNRNEFVKRILGNVPITKGIVRNIEIKNCKNKEQYFITFEDANTFPTTFMVNKENLKIYYDNDGNETFVM